MSDDTTSALQRQPPATSGDLGRRLTHLEKTAGPSTVFVFDQGDPERRARIADARTRGLPVVVLRDPYAEVETDASTQFDR